MDAAAYVLQDFPRLEAEILPQILDRAVEAVLTFVSEGIVTAMNSYNTLLDSDL
jgi:peptidyl-tRNA hydrolase